MTYKPFFISVPWPSAHLSPNGGVHWRNRHKAGKVAKAIATLKVRAWKASNGEPNPDASLLRYTFHPPTNRRRDDDNLTARMKPYRDAIAAELGINDSTLYTCRPAIAPPDKANPRVTIELIVP